jgi:tRNA threonylcarbamoyladenosine biosynthesis protein TsaE
MQAMDCRTAEETKSLGQKLGRYLKKHPGFVLLVGELGMGKTTLAQGVAEGLGVEGPVQSPTFTLVAEYALKDGTFFHADLYRIKSKAELFALGILERLEEGIWLVEWGEDFTEFWPEKLIVVRIAEKGEGRCITLKGLEDGWDV